VDKLRTKGAPSSNYWTKDDFREVDNMKQIAWFFISFALILCVSTETEGEKAQGREEIKSEIKTDIETKTVIEEKPVKEYSETDAAALKFMQEDFGQWVISYAYGNDIDPYLIFAIMEHESDFKADAMGDNGESYGLMQVQKKWHAERMEKLGVTDLLDPQGNVKVGIDILQEYAGRNSDLYYVLMAYNGGEAYAKKYYETSPSAYAVEITERAAQLCEIYEEAAE
jgi:hypothetical protein